MANFTSPATAAQITNNPRRGTLSYPIAGSLIAYCIAWNGNETAANANTWAIKPPPSWRLQQIVYRTDSSSTGLIDIKWALANTGKAPTGEQFIVSQIDLDTAPATDILTPDADFLDSASDLGALQSGIRSLDQTNGKIWLNVHLKDSHVWTVVTLYFTASDHINDITEE